MKKGIIVTAVMLSFLIIAIKSNARVKITPDTVGASDIANVKMKCNLNTGGYVDVASGGAVIGTNTYDGNYLSYGGFFEAHSFTGRGVYGRSFGASGKGVFGHAANIANVQNYGGFFRALGGKGYGVYGS